MTKKRPYLLRAMHEWILDNDMTPHIIVDVTHPGLVVPPGHASDGKLVLNISPTATAGLLLGNEVVTFEARFGGVSRHLEVPVDAILGIYARENGHGMIFSEEEPPPAGPDKPSGRGTPSGSDKPAGGEPKRPALKIVK